MKFLRWVLLLLMVSFAGFAQAASPGPDDDAFWYGTAPDGTPSIKIYFFWTPTCPHCQASQPFIRALPDKYPWIELLSYPVKDNKANSQFYFDTAAALGKEALSVPGFLFCRQVEIGYDTEATTGAYLLEQLQACRERLLANPPGAGGAASGGTPAAGTDGGVVSGAPAAEAPPVKLPFVGELDAKAWSLPLLTVALAGMDAFNPCAFFVLLFLLSLLVHAKSRSRMLIVGGTFVTFSGLVYFVFMAAWLNVFLVAGELRAITFAAGLLALVIGLINVKDYFWFKAGVSLSIPESAKPGLFKRMRDIVAAGSMGPMLLSTVLLAIVANSYELLCTAGFPMVYTRTLTLAKLETWEYYGWLALYNVIYVLPLLAIVIVFVKTMGARKLTESEGRILKLVSGYMMAAFGVVLVTAPQFLTNALLSIAIIVVAVALAFLTAAVWKRSGHA